MFACFMAVLLFRTRETLTVDTTCFITVVRTVVNFITLLGAVNTGAIATLELIRSACKQC